jgi:hypothetical protein
VNLSDQNVSTFYSKDAVQFSSTDELDKRKKVRKKKRKKVNFNENQGTYNINNFEVKQL